MGSRWVGEGQHEPQEGQVEGPHLTPLSPQPVPPRSQHALQPPLRTGILCWAGPSGSLPAQSQPGRQRLYTRCRRPDDPLPHPTSLPRCARSSPTLSQARRVIQKLTTCTNMPCAHTNVTATATWWQRRRSQTGIVQRAGRLRGQTCQMLPVPRAHAAWPCAGQRRRGRAVGISRETPPMCTFLPR